MLLVLYQCFLLLPYSEFQHDFNKNTVEYSKFLFKIGVESIRWLLVGVEGLALADAVGYIALLSSWK